MFRKVSLRIRFLGGIFSLFIMPLWSLPLLAQDWQGLPEGVGREEVFYTCGACHSLMLVKQQRLTKPVWDKTLTWMVSEKNMAEPEPMVRERILDYLATHYSYRPAAAPTTLAPLPLLGR